MLEILAFCIFFLGIFCQERLSSVECWLQTFFLIWGEHLTSPTGCFFSFSPPSLWQLLWWRLCFVSLVWEVFLRLVAENSFSLSQASWFLVFDLWEKKQHCISQTIKRNIDIIFFSVFSLNAFTIWQELLNWKAKIWLRH